MCKLAIHLRSGLASRVLALTVELLVHPACVQAVKIKLYSVYGCNSETHNISLISRGWWGEVLSGKHTGIKMMLIINKPSVHENTFTIVFGPKYMYHYTTHAPFTMIQVHFYPDTTHPFHPDTTHTFYPDTTHNPFTQINQVLNPDIIRPFILMQQGPLP